MIPGDRVILSLGDYRLIKICRHEFENDKEYMKKHGSFALHTYGKPCLKCGTHLVGVPDKKK